MQAPPEGWEAFGERMMEERKRERRKRRRQAQAQKKREARKAAGGAMEIEKEPKEPGDGGGGEESEEEEESGEEPDEQIVHTADTGVVPDTAAEGTAGPHTRGALEGAAPGPAEQAGLGAPPDNPPDGRQGLADAVAPPERDPEVIEQKDTKLQKEEYTERGLRPRNAAGAVIRTQRGRVFRRGGGRH
jgi:hypothetical protein